MPVGRTLFAGSPYLGVFLRAGERAVIVPPSTPAPLERELTRVLGTNPIRTTVCESEVVGALVAANSNGFVVGDTLDPHERRALESVAPVSVVRDRRNALGNNVLVNDTGALVHPEFTDSALAALSHALGVPATRSTVAGLGTVGMAGIATNRGVVLHPKATEKEAAVAEKALGVPVHRSSANFGVPVVGACVVANSRGLLVGRPTTPVEIVHLQEGLSLFD
ncbi:MAG TPA: translation initiation factor IF-6 [Thermoplasmata archaeon]|nr:translation initiation factor IF-6 [Thermoplasmata archaeon]